MTTKSNGWIWLVRKVLFAGTRQIKILLLPGISSKTSFLKAFGKNLFDLDLQGLSLKYSPSEDPLAYAFEILDYVMLANPQATELEKVQRLFDKLPVAMKSFFIRHPPKSVQDFLERLKDVSREQQYVHKRTGKFWKFWKTSCFIASNLASNTPRAVVSETSDVAPGLRTLTAFSKGSNLSEREALDFIKDLGRKLSKIEEAYTATWLWIGCKRFCS